jgi:sulfoxide reductase heme-binding subunit YedZ
MPFNPTPRQLSVIKAIVFVLALLPFARLFWGAYSNTIGANPVEFVTWSTGDWTLYFLCMTLAITPLRRLTKWNWLVRLRRMVGLFAFFYAVLHFMTYLWLDQEFDVTGMLYDIAKRPFILVGFTAFVLLIPLAITSTNGMVKRLGAKNWQWLHRLIYVIAPLGILHFWWMKAGKHNFQQPIIFGTIVAVLLLLRAVWTLQKRAKEKSLQRQSA